MAKVKFSGKKSPAPKKPRKGGGGSGRKSQAWRSYTGGGRVSNAPIPD